MLRLTTSLAIIFGSFCLGLSVSIQGPTLMDLIDVLHVNQDMMSYALAYAGLAYSFGGLLSGFIYNYLNRQLLMVFYLFVFGAANLVTPWLPSYLLFAVITFLKMIAGGGSDCGFNVWMLELRPGQDSWLQALHFAFACGTAIGPLLAEPFLSPELPDEHELERLHGPNYSQAENFTMPEPGESRIYVPYSICGLCAVCASSFLLILFFVDPYKPPGTRKGAKSKDAIGVNGKSNLSTALQPLTTEKSTTTAISLPFIDEAINLETTPLDANMTNAPSPQSSTVVVVPATPQVSGATPSPLDSASTGGAVVIGKSPNKPKKRPPGFVIFAITLASLCILFYCGVEITSMNYLATFAVNTDLQLSKSTAAYLSSALTTSFMVGRLVGIYMALKMKPEEVFYVCAIVMTIGNVLMMIFANTNETLLWVSVCLIGSGCGPMYPAVLSFYDEIQKVSNTTSGIFIMTSMFSVALSSLIVGHHIIDNALILVELNLAGSVLLLALFGWLHLMTRARKSRKSKKIAKQQQNQLTDGANQQTIDYEKNC